LDIKQIVYQKEPFLQKERTDFESIIFFSSNII